jgi:hypothetical protein
MQVTLRQASAAEDLPPVVVETGPFHDARIYGISDGDCTIKWIVYTTETNRGVIKHSARCPVPLARQLPWLTRIYEEILDKDSAAASFHTLYWGGLVPEQRPALPELPLRLALAAYRSRGWDVERGKPLAGDLNSFVKDLANSEQIYPELKTLFDRFRRSITIASVEKVRVLEAGKLPFSNELSRQGVRSKDRLPFDCMMWFSVSENVKEQGK